MLDQQNFCNHLQAHHNHNWWYIYRHTNRSTIATKRSKQKQQNRVCALWNNLRHSDVGGDFLSLCRHNFCSFLCPNDDGDDGEWPADWLSLESDHIKEKQKEKNHHPAKRSVTIIIALVIIIAQLLLSSFPLDYNNNNHKFIGVLRSATRREQRKKIPTSSSCVGIFKEHPQQIFVVELRLYCSSHFEGWELKRLFFDLLWLIFLFCFSFFFEVQWILLFFFVLFVFLN